MHFPSKSRTTFVPASSITPCSRNTRNIESCIIAEANKLKPLLAGGDLGDGFQIPPMEPLALDRIIIRPSPEFNAVFTNLQVNGPTAFVVEKLKWAILDCEIEIVLWHSNVLWFCRANVENLAFDFSVFLPKLNFTGNYALKMRLLLFNIQGQGPVTGTFCKYTYVIDVLHSRNFFVCHLKKKRTQKLENFEIFWAFSKPKVPYRFLHYP